MDQGFDESSPLTLLHLLTFSDPPGYVVSNPKKWDWFGPILLEAVRKNHQKFAPQIALAIGLPYRASGLPEDYLLNENILNNIFGKDAKALMMEMTKPFKFNAPMEEVRGTDFSLVNVRARKWLELNKVDISH